MKPGLSSFETSQLKTNADGSVDVYVGPKAPPGLEANWIPTQGKVPYPVLRFYGPHEAFWNNTFVMSDFALVE
jgi:hypothetical protein